MPLQFLALNAVVDHDRFDVRIIDARIEKSVQIAHAKVKELLPNAICLGISTITGSPLKDAVKISQLSKALAPHVPVVWGGWHSSIYPEQCLREGYSDFCVSGQGEMTFLELLDAIDFNAGFENILGLSYLKHDIYIKNPERKFIDINQFSAYDFGKLELESYFKFKNRRQLDFYSSQGCPYRCAFCADPFVYNRRWSGLTGARMLLDVFEAVRRYRIEDIVFQDENFFANKNRVAEFCAGIQSQGVNFSWTATSRADQIAALEEDMLNMLANANLRKVMIGAESGAQEMLDFMKKDTLSEEALISAENLSRHGIGAAFNFIVGFPEESFEHTLMTLDTIKKIKKINHSFEFNIFFFTPYPGTELFDYIVRKGYHVPQSLLEWSDIDFVMYAGYWVSKSERKYVENFKFYTKLATEYGIRRKWLRPVNAIAKIRTDRNFYSLPLEKGIVNFIRHKILNEVNW